ncbi:MAG: hypothetical protein Kow00124_27490 [Anaerolineae bacterium]
MNGLSGRLAAARHDLDRALVVARREVIDMLRDWRIIAPIVILTVIFPSIANWGAGRMVGWVQQYGADLVGERLIPFLMMVVGFFPISFSLIIALESFVGEKERHSLEPLLASPLSNLQLYIGKTLSSTVPPFIGSLLGITVYLVGVYFNVGWTPPPVLLAQVVLLSIAHALVMVSGAVIISSQVTSVRAANLLSSFIIIPMAFLIQGEALIMFWAQYGVLWWILAGLLMVNAVLVRMGTRIFNREQLLGKEIDDLNLFSGIRSWWRLTLARREGSPRRSPWTWYRQEVLGQLPRLLPALALLAAAVVVGYFIGREYADVYRIPPDVFVVDNWYERFSEVLIQSGLVGIGGVWRVIFQNIRVLIVASLLGMFTFGVLTVLVLMIPFALVGYLIAQMTVAGLDPVMLWAALIPHSMLEVPAALLAGAAAIRLGASVIAPPPGKTLGEGWLSTLADATRLWGALILPLLILAAVVEVFVTPTIILMMGR